MVTSIDWMHWAQKLCPHDGSTHGSTIGASRQMVHEALMMSDGAGILRLFVRYIITDVHSARAPTHIPPTALSAAAAPHVKSTGLPVPLHPPWTPSPTTPPNSLTEGRNTSDRASSTR